MKPPIEPKHVSLAALIIAATSGIGSAELPVSHDHPAIPPGLRPGDSFQLLFVTSATTNRDSGGGEDHFDISHWNSFVDGAATASTVPDIQPTTP
jgi:hypothetical protein